MQMIRKPLLALLVGSVTASTAPAQDFGMQAGKLLIDLELPSIDGSETLRLSGFRGAKTLLIQFASW